MYLGIEIGGTKLQVGVGDGRNVELHRLVRRTINARAGAKAIRKELEAILPELCEQHEIAGIGVGFGGPVDPTNGFTTTSHQVTGWDQFPLVEWVQRLTGAATKLANDCDAAALAEANLGEYRQARSLAYVTVGTGIGGGYVVDRQLQGSARPAIAEIGHLRPGVLADDANTTVESFASGWGIMAVAEELTRRTLHPQSTCTQSVGWHDCLDSVLERLRFDPAAPSSIRDAQKLLELQVSQAKQLATHYHTNQIARHSIASGRRILAWAIAQWINLNAPECVVVGGGVSLMEREVFLQPLKEEVAGYVFRPLRDSYRVEAASLGEEVVLHGAIALAAR